MAGDSDGTEHSFSFQLEKKKKKKAPEVSRNGSLSKPPLPPPHTENTEGAKSLVLIAMGLSLIEHFLAVNVTCAMEIRRGWRGTWHQPNTASVQLVFPSLVLSPPCDDHHSYR